jgi:myo-inositol-1(or 4)-monophosphatase
MIRIMNAEFLEEACAFAEEIAAEAARLCLTMRDDVSFERKADGSPVTETDRALQRMLEDRVREAYPEHAFLGEEVLTGERVGPRAGECRYCWVVDPLDGTRNFTRGFPLHATSIALMDGDRPVVGVVREHFTGWTVSAVTGGGTMCCGKPSQVATNPASRQCVVAVPSGRGEPILPIIRRWTDRYVMRNVGSTALHMAYVASGAVDAVICFECKLWDVAAGKLLIEEAGGRIVGMDGEPYVLPTPGDYDGEELSFFAGSVSCFDELFSELNTGEPR